MIPIVNGTSETDEKQVETVIKKYAKHFDTKSRKLNSTSLNLTIGLRTKVGSELTRELMTVNGVNNANLLTHNGEATL